MELDVETRAGGLEIVVSGGLELADVARALASDCPDMLSIHGPDGVYRWASASTQELLGFAPEQLLGRGAYELFHRDDIQRISGDHAGHDGAETRVSYRIGHASGEYIWVETHSRACLGSDGRVAQIVASTRRLSGDPAELGSHAEVLREHRHQINNSLQVVFGLLSLPADRTNNGDVRALLLGVRARVAALAALNTALDNLGHIRAKAYIEPLVTSLVRLHGRPAGVEVTVTVEPGLVLSPNFATSLGLIVAELVSNSLRHAFPNGGPGKIEVTARSVSAGVELIVRDDGVGFDSEAEAADALGLKTACRLAAVNPGGLELVTARGTYGRVCFSSENHGG